MDALLQKKEQELFEFILLGLVEQGDAPRCKGIPACRYKGDNGCRCAVGVLIHIEEDTFTIPALGTGGKPVLVEGCGVKALREQVFAWFVEQGETLHARELTRFLGAVQAVFDGTLTTHPSGERITADEFYTYLAQRMRLFARRHNLRYPEEILG